MVIIYILWTIIPSDPDNDEPQEMGNCDIEEPVELTDEQMDAVSAKKAEAMGAFSEREWQKAIDLFTDVIKMDSRYSLSLAGGIYMKVFPRNLIIFAFSEDSK